MAIALEVPVENEVGSQTELAPHPLDDAVLDPPPIEVARPLRWTWDECLRLEEQGFFEGRRVQLIEGEIIEMGAMNGPHWVATGLVYDALRRIFNDDFVVVMGLPIKLSELSGPEPDVSVVRGHIRDYKENIPATALLVVEVSVSTLAYDRSGKMSLYAKYGIEEYWLLNVEARQLEVHRRPMVQAEMPFGFGYAERRIFGAGESVETLAAPGSPVLVSDLLP